MALDMLSIGNKVEIVESSAVRNGVIDDGNTPALVSQIYDIVDDDHLQIEMPLRGTQMVLLDLRIRYQICIYTPHGLFKCAAQVIDRFKSENRYIAVIEFKSALKRFQRREFFRLEKLFEIKYRRLSEEEKEMHTSEEIVEKEKLGTAYNAAVAVDLSGGGARLIMNEKFSVDEMIFIHFKFSPEEGDLKFAGKIVVCNQMKTDNTQYENRIKFIKIKEKDREKLIRYIFEEERKMRFKRKS